VTRGSLCTEKRPRRAQHRFRKSLALWDLRSVHRRTGAVSAFKPMPVATHVFRCLSWHRRRLGCALHPNLRHGSLPDQRSLAGRHPTTASRETRVAGCHPPACAKLRSLPDGRKSPQPRFSTAYSAPTTRSGGWARIPAVPFLAPRDIGIRRSPILARHALAHHVPATPPHGDLEGQRPRKRLRIWSARSFPNGNTNPRLTPCTLLKGPPFRLGRSSLGISMSRMGSSRLHSFTCAQYPTIPCG